MSKADRSPVQWKDIRWSGYERVLLQSLPEMHVGPVIRVIRLDAPPHISSGDIWKPEVITFTRDDKKTMAEGKILVGRHRNKLEGTDRREENLLLSFFDLFNDSKKRFFIWEAYHDEIFGDYTPVWVD